MIVVNGLLHIQVGRFTKAYTPRFLHDGFLAVYETYSTITTFPLMHCTYRHGIPIRYLNFTAMATKSYMAWHAVDRNDKKARDYAWKHQWDDWKDLQRTIAVYRALCMGADSMGFSYSRWEKLSKSLKVEFNALLERNEFKPHDEHWSDMYGHYWNPYCSVFFTNMARQDKDRWRWSVDYYEENA
jgi:hypothetical protein